MSTLYELTPKTFVARKQYPRSIIKKLWVGFRAEWIKANLSREKFTNYVADVISEAPQKAKMMTLDGSEFLIPDDLPRPETFENFMKSGVIGQTNKILYEEPGQNAYASTRTLQVIHLFLWCLRPETVTQWTEIHSLNQHTKLVENLDSSFEVLPISDLVSARFKLFHIEYDKLPEGTNALQMMQKHSEEQETFCYEENHWTFAGILCIDLSENRKSCIARYFESDLWLRIQHSWKTVDNPNINDTFQEYTCIFPGSSSAIRSKNIEFNGASKPIIHSNLFYFIISQQDTLINDIQYASFQGEPHLIRYFVNHQSFFEAWMNFARDTGRQFGGALFYKTNDQYEKGLIPVRLNDDEEQILDQICNLGAY